MKYLVFALIALFAMAFASNQQSAGYYDPWDVRDIQISAPVLTGETVVIPNTFGDLKYVNFTNLNGGDVNVTLSNEEGTLITGWTRVLTQYTNYTNRSITASTTIYGKTTLRIIPTQYNGTTIAAQPTCWFSANTNTTNITLPATVGTCYMYQYPTVDISLGKIDNATYLNGVDDYVQINNTAHFNVSAQSHSISMWIKPNRLPDNTYLLYKGTAANNTTNATAVLYTIEVLNSSTINWTLTANETINYVNYTNTGLFNSSAWTHFAFTTNATEMRIYINGASVASATYASHTKNYTTAHNLMGLGKLNTTHANMGVDEVLYWNSQLTAAKVAGVYNASVHTNNILAKIVYKRI